MDLINDKNVELVDICIATPMHVEYAVAALKKALPNCEKIDGP